jgi:hypothetical protein
MNLLLSSYPSFNTYCNVNIFVKTYDIASLQNILSLVCNRKW